VLKPRVFIASSSEGLDVASAIQAHLEKVAEVTIWDQDIFQPSDNILDSIRQAAQTSAHAIFVFTPDDTLTLRDQTVRAARDNVLFELGIFIGSLGLRNTMIVHPGNVRDFHLPSDLAGLTTLKYDGQRSDGNVIAALAPACAKMKRVIGLSQQTDSCGYLTRYIAREEHSLVGGGAETRISFERAYKLLLYMFQRESFHQFRAFDLAFERWEELLKRNLFQTFNFSNEIFDSVGHLLKEGRCPTFRRILVVTFDQLKKPSSTETVRRFLEQETAWRTQLPNIDVETRIFLYPDVYNRETRDRIRQLHDFALFSGEEEQFAIVETTLTSPTDRVSAPEFLVTTSIERINQLKAAFEDFWRSSVALGTILANLGGLIPEEEDTRPAVRALSVFTNACPQIDEDCAIVIEAGYFDLRSLGDEDRMAHLDDAFWLLESIQTAYKGARASIFLEAFINDFSTSNVCQITACSPAVDLQNSDRRDQVLLDLQAGLKRRYEFYDMTLDDFTVFGMRRTRNEVARAMAKALKAGRRGIIERQLGDTTVDIYADSYTEHILLGHRDVESSGIVPRCAALMAQHYRDLYEFARKRRPTLNKLWIFDFNRLTEKESVRLGAESTSVLYSWPSDFELNIVNCIYSADGRSGGVSVIHGPK
jgi:Predicted nucleotide-binding protein containing TIR-like domain